MQMRSVNRDIKAMSMGLDFVNNQINLLLGNIKLRKAERKRLERLQAIKVQMVENPEDCNQLVKRYKEMT